VLIEGSTDPAATSPSATGVSYHGSVYVQSWLNSYSYCSSLLVIGMANPNPQAGVACLYLPERLFAAARNAVLPQQTPFPAVGLLPYAVAQITPQLMPQVVNPDACIPLLAAPLSVNKQKTSATTAAVSSLPPNRRLVTLRRSRQLWQTLIAYCDDCPRMPGVPSTGVSLGNTIY
jgi:hypothetical protein